MSQVCVRMHNADIEKLYDKVQVGTLVAITYCFILYLEAEESMKTTGIVRKVDKLGRVVIPVELRKVLGIKEKDPIEILVDGNYIILQKYKAKINV